MAVDIFPRSYQVLLQQTLDKTKVFQWIRDLSCPESRQDALRELSNKIELIPNLGPLLWDSSGVPVIIQEITNVYPFLDPLTLNGKQANRVRNAIKILSSLAYNPETLPKMIETNLLQFLFPFLNNLNAETYDLRLSSLVVVGSLAQADDKNVFMYLIDIKMMPTCVNIMIYDSGVTTILATYILQRILHDKFSRLRVCESREYLEQVLVSLQKMVKKVSLTPEGIVLEHVLRSYLLLADHPRARLTLRYFLPQELRNINNFAASIAENGNIINYLRQLWQKLGLCLRV